MIESENKLQECLIPDELKSYFSDLFEKQKEDIKRCIVEQLKNQANNEIEQLKNAYKNESDKRKKFEDECKKLEGKLKSLNKLIDELESKDKESNDKIKSLVEIINERERAFLGKETEARELATQVEQVKRNLGLYEARYQAINKTYEIYQALSEETKRRLRNVIATDTIYSLITAASEWRNIEGIWNYIRRRIIENELDDVEYLTALFEFLLKAYNEQSTDKKYELIKPMVGEKFDSDKHIIIGTETDGYVSRIRLSGMMETRTGKVIQKAIIEI